MSVSAKKRKRLNFAEASTLVLEGIGHGPLKTVAELEAAARQLRARGQTELWNFLGDHKTPNDTEAFLCKVWRLNGDLAHPMFKEKAPYALDTFSYEDLKSIQEWLDGKYKTHTLVLSGDGDLGKTNLAEALASAVSPNGGYFFVDDPDDLRELTGYLRAKVPLVVDEITLAGFSPNQVKKLMDLAKMRRIKCRHFNGTIPAGCPRIFCTNSSLDNFYPDMPDKQDRTGVMRRQLFVVVGKSVIKSAAAPSMPIAARTTEPGVWTEALARALDEAALGHHREKATQVCKDLEVAFLDEILEFADDVANACGMGTLASRRFKAALQGGTQPGVPTHAPAQRFDEADDGDWLPGVGECDE